MHKIAKLLSAGDVVFSSESGEKMKVTRIYRNGFDAQGMYFSFDDVRHLYFLTKKGYLDSRKSVLHDDLESYDGT